MELESTMSAMPVRNQNSLDSITLASHFVTLLSGNRKESKPRFESDKDVLMLGCFSNQNVRRRIAVRTHASHSVCT
jgi:hypothetical protein